MTVLLYYIIVCIPYIYYVYVYYIMYTYRCQASEEEGSNRRRHDNHGLCRQEPAAVPTDYERSRYNIA